MGKRSESSKGRNLGLRVENSLAEKIQKKGMNNLPQAPGENRPTEPKESPTVKTNTDSTMVRKDMGLIWTKLTKGGTNSMIIALRLEEQEEEQEGKSSRFYRAIMSGLPGE